MDIDENGPEDAEVNQGYIYILKLPPPFPFVSKVIPNLQRAGGVNVSTKYICLNWFFCYVLILTIPLGSNLFSRFQSIYNKLFGIQEEGEEGDKTEENVTEQTHHIIGTYHKLNTLNSRRDILIYCTGGDDTKYNHHHPSHTRTPHRCVQVFQSL